MAKQEKENKKSLSRPSFIDGIISDAPEDSLIDQKKAKAKLKQLEEDSRRTKAQQSFYQTKKRIRQTPNQDNPIWDKQKKDFFDNLPKKKTRKTGSFKFPEWRSKLKIKKPKLGFNLRLKLTRVNLVIVGIAVVVLGILISGSWSIASQLSDIEGKVSGATVKGQKHLNLAQQAVEEMDVVKASQEFELASKEIAKATQVLNNKGQITEYWSKLPFQKREEFKLINFLSQVEQSSTDLEDLFGLFEQLVNQTDYSLAMKKKLGFRLKRTSYNLNQLDKTVINLASSKRFFPSQMEKYQKSIQAINQQIIMISELIDYTDELLGYKEPEKYLLMFQNNAETRPTGGFLGTYGYLTLEDGQTKDLKIDQIYRPPYVQREKLADIYQSKLGYPSNMPKELIPAKPLLERYKKAFYIQNVNCTPDFPLVAKRALWSFENILELDKADKAIALDPTIITDILKIIGPIKLVKYNVVLTYKNFRQVIQYKVDMDNPFVKGEDYNYNPKQILADFTPKFLKKIHQTSLNNKFKIFFKLFENLKQKHILIYAQDQEISQMLEQYGYDGRLKEYDGDYLQINMMIGRGNKKTGLRIEKDYRLSSKLTQKGRINHQLSINLTRRLGSSRTEIWQRVIVPYGSKLVKASHNGKNVTNRLQSFIEADKQVWLFRCWITTDITSKLKVKYQTSAIYNQERGYNILLQSQPGITNSTITVDQTLPKSLDLTKYQPEKIKRAGDQLFFKDKFVTDKELRLEFK